MCEHPINHQLTPEQEALIPVYQEKWRKIALSTERIDRQKAADAVKAAYKLIGKEEPEIIFFDSLYPAAKFIWFEGCYSDLDFFWDLKERLPGVNYYISEYPTKDMELFKIIRGIEGCAIAEADKILSVDDAILCDEFSEGHIQTDTLCYEFGWNDFCFSELKYNRSQEWKIYQDILENCGRIYAYEEACLVCDRVATPQEYRPTLLSFDNQNRLHALGEPAIEYADGFKVYAHHGVWRPEA